MDATTLPARAVTGSPDTCPRSTLAERALAHWPRLDRRSLRRCAGDVACVVRLVARRTRLPPETIRLILNGPVSDADRELWFG